MAIDFQACHCDGLRYSTYVDMTRKLADQVRIARTFGAAAGIVFRATHPDIQRQPVELETPDTKKKRCQDCMPHIGRVIADEGLRPQEEFEQWKTGLRAAKQGDCSNCHNCPNPGNCSVSFDLSPI